VAFLYNGDIRRNGWLQPVLHDSNTAAYTIPHTTLGVHIMFSMPRVRTLIVAGLTALALTAGTVATAPSAQLAGDPSQWGIAKKGSFDITEVNGVAKVNEYEGQHRIAKVNEYEGQHRVAKVNEYEGQHRVTAA
jgi:hypothetical protein